MKPSFLIPALVAVSLCTCSSLVPPARGADSSSSSQDASAQSPISANLTIPGPLRSFLRMAGISQKASPEEIAPLLARTVFQRGYEGSAPRRHPTEFLLLLIRYVQQARELTTLAGSEGVLQIGRAHV